MINWSDYVDAIYCLHFLPYKDKKEYIEKELKRVGIADSGILKYHYTFPSKFDKFILDRLKYNKKLIPDHIVPRATNVGLAHYSIYQEALGLGYERIFIVEDDVAFLKDVDRIKDILDHAPSDWDFLKLDKTRCPQFEDRLKTIVPGPYFGSNYTGGYWALGFCGVSNNAFPIGIGSLEHEIMVCDQIFENRDLRDFSKIKRYVSNTSLVRQLGDKYNWSYEGLINPDDYNM